METDEFLSQIYLIYHAQIKDWIFGTGFFIFCFIKLSLTKWKKIRRLFTKALPARVIFFTTWKQFFAYRNTARNRKSKQIFVQILEWKFDLTWHTTKQNRLRPSLDLIDKQNFRFAQRAHFSAAITVQHL